MLLFLEMHIISYHIISYLSMVAHSTKLVYKGPCIIFVV